MKIRYFGIALLTLLCGAFLSAQSRQDQTVALDHVALQAQNLEQSARFYEQIVGLKRIPDPFKDGKHIWFAISGNQQLHLDPIDKAMPTTDDSHFALRVASIDTFIKHLEANHVKWEGFHAKAQPNLRPDGVHQIYFQDPSGNWIEVNDRKAQ